MIGQKLLHYEIVEKLGEGGMGVVYKARDTHLDRFVALKLLPAEKVADPERKTRFVQEAKAASALNHGNIVTIHDIASDQGTDFIAMEYVAGKTLAQLIPKKGLPLNEALRIALQIAAALARAHAAGIVHRDLKPSNVIVDAHGAAKLLDFGLAKLVEPVTSDDATTAPIGVKTEEGIVVGTVAYMSPEQAQGRPLDGRSDIFSFGAVLYEMLAGRRAFQSTSKLGVLAAVLREEPPALPSETPADLAKIVQRCLRKDPDRRFQHMDDIKVALEDVKDDSDSGKLAAAVPPAAWSARPLVWAAAGGGLVLLLAIGGWFLRPKPAEPVAALKATPKAEPPAPPLRAVPLTANPGIETDPCFSPDGNRVAYSWNGEKQDNFDIFVKSIGPGGPLRLTTDPARDCAPAWSPDDKWIAFLRVPPGAGPAALMLVPSLGGPERRLGEIAVNRDYLLLHGVTWTKDGNGLLACHAGGLGAKSGLLLFPISGGDPEQLTTGNVYSPVLSPEGRRLVFVRTSGMNIYDLFIQELAADLTPHGESRRLTEMNESIISPTWTPDGKAILFSTGGHLASRSLWRIAVSTGSTPRKEPVGEDCDKLAVSRDGRRLVYSRLSSDADIWRLEVRNRTEVTAPPVRFISSTRYDHNAQYSPDGKWIVFNSLRSGFEEVFKTNTDGSSHPLQLTSVGGPLVANMRWSPDSRTLAIDSMVGGERGIDLLSAEGGSLKRLVGGGCFYPTWSRDGQWIYFAKRGQISKVPREGGEEIQVTKGGGHGPAFESIDGKILYYRKGLRVWQLTFTDGKEVQVVSERLSYSMNITAVDDGLYLIAAPSDRDPGGLCFYDANSQQLTKLLTIPRWFFGLSVSPDGRSILYSQKEEERGSLMLVENFR